MVRKSPGKRRNQTFDIYTHNIMKSIHFEQVYSSDLIVRTKVHEVHLSVKQHHSGTT